MGSLDDLFNSIKGQSQESSINSDEEKKLDAIDENTGGDPINNTTNDNQVHGNESPNDFAEPVNDDGGNAAEPEGEGTSKKTDEPEGEEEDLTLELDWDDDEDVLPTDDPSLDVSDLIKELGTSDIKDKDGLVEHVKSLQSKISELENESSKQLEDIPSDLAKAINVAKAGGDYMAALQLSSIDYSKIDPIELFENDVVEKMKDENGNVDYDKVDEYLDSMSDVDKTLRGKELQRHYIESQNQQLKRIEHEAAVKKEQADAKLESAVNSKEEIAGFKLKPQHKRMLIDGIKTGNMMNELFLDNKGQYDFNKISDTYFKIKFFDKIQKVYENKIKNGTKKEMIDSVTNSTVNRPQKLANAAEQPKNKIDSYLESLMNKNN